MKLEVLCESERFDTCPTCGSSYATISGDSVACPNINCIHFNKEYLGIIPALIDDKETRKFLSQKHSALRSGLLTEPDPQRRISRSHDITEADLQHISNGCDVTNSLGEYRIYGHWYGKYYRATLESPAEYPEWEWDTDETEMVGSDICPEAIEIFEHTLTERGLPILLSWSKVLLIARLVAELKEPDGESNYILVEPTPKKRAEEARDEEVIATPVYEIIWDERIEANRGPQALDESYHKLTLRMIDDGTSVKYNKLINEKGSTSGQYNYGGLLFVLKGQLT